MLCLKKKYAIFITLSMIVSCLTNGTMVLFIEIIACNTLNRHLVAKDQRFLRDYANSGKKITFVHLKAKAFDQLGQRSYNNHLMHEGVLVNVSKI